MKYRIITTRHKESNNIAYHIQQRIFLFFYRNIFETSDYDDAKETYKRLVTIEDIYARGFNLDYVPPPSIGYQPKGSDFPRPSECNPPTRD